MAHTARRPDDPPPLPHVLRKQLVLHMAYVGLPPPHRMSLTNGYTEFNEYNGTVFNIRARSLNNLVYWMAQIVGSLLMGALLDGHGLRRRVRAFLGWGTLFALVFVVHIWAYFYQRSVGNRHHPIPRQRM